MWRPISSSRAGPPCRLRLPATQAPPSAAVAGCALRRPPPRAGSLVSVPSHASAPPPTELSRVRDVEFAPVRTAARGGRSRVATTAPPVELARVRRPRRHPRAELAASVFVPVEPARRNPAKPPELLQNVVKPPRRSPVSRLSPMRCSARSPLPFPSPLLQSLFSRLGQLVSADAVRLPRAARAGTPTNRNWE